MKKQGHQDRDRREGTRAQPRTSAINPGAAGQIGQVVAKNPVEWNNGAVLNTGTKLGNEMTHQGAGPGGGRSVRRSGSQALHGINPGNPTPARDILSEYGPDYKGSR